MSIGLSLSRLVVALVAIVTVTVYVPAGVADVAAPQAEPSTANQPLLNEGCPSKTLIPRAVNLLPICPPEEDTVEDTEPAPEHPATGARTETVELPTGDTVHAEVHPGGVIDVAVDFRERSDGVEPDVNYLDDGESLYVIPDDADIDTVEDREAYDVASQLAVDRGSSSSPAGESEPQASHQTHNLTIEGYHRDGTPFNGSMCSLAIMNMEDRSQYSRPTGTNCAEFEDGESTHEVPAGPYAVVGIDRDSEADELTFLGDPSVQVNEDTRVVLNGTQATEVTLDLEEQDDVWSREKSMAYFLVPEEGQPYKNSHGMWGHADLYATGTADPVEVGVFKFMTKWEMDAPERGVGGYAHPDGPAYDGPTELYYLPFTMEAPIPQDLSFELVDQLEEKAAIVQDRIHSNLEASSAVGNDTPHYREFRHHWLHDPSIEGSITRINHVSVPVNRTEIITPDELLRHRVAGDPEGFSYLNEPIDRYDGAGEQPAESWFAEPLGPGLIPQAEEYFRDRNKPTPVTREDDTLNLEIPEVLDAGGQHGWASDVVMQTANRVPGLIVGQWPGLTTDFRLLVDGEESPQTFTEFRPRGSYQMQAEPATYTIEVETQADDTYAWGEREFQTTTAWTFDSQRPEDGGEQILPLVTVDYDLGLDVFNTLPAGQTSLLELKASHQAGAIDPAIEDAQLNVSYDEGESWQQAPLVEDEAGRYTATITPPADASTLSLQTTVTDEEGNRYEQELLRAAGIR